MNLGIISTIISLIVLVYFAIQYFKTKEFISKLPILTRSKYSQLEVLSRVILIIDVVLFLVSLFITNSIFKILIVMIIIFASIYAISELGVLKEYISKKKSR